MRVMGPPRLLGTREMGHNTPCGGAKNLTMKLPRPGFLIPGFTCSRHPDTLKSVSLLREPGVDSPWKEVHTVGVSLFPACLWTSGSDYCRLRIHIYL